MPKINLPKISLLSGIFITVSLFIVLAIAHLRGAFAGPTPTLLFGIGPEAADAINFPLVKEAPVKMLSSWFNNTNDLNWMDDSWHLSLIKDTYAKGYTHHVIAYNNDTEGNLNTPHGPACGRAYPLSPQFVTDMGKLAEIYKGSGPVYFTLLTEFQGYTCEDNHWVGNENYFNSLKANYILAMNKIREVNPQAKVSLGWGGWQARFDEPDIDGGRSLIPHFDDIMKQSQFQSFQAMQSDNNGDDIKAMSKILGAYGPVMLAHYKPDNASQSTFDNDVRTILTDSFLQEVTSNGLFAMSFMDHKNIGVPSSTFTFLKDAIGRYTTQTGASPSVTAAPTTNATVVPSSTAVATASPVVTRTPSSAPTNVPTPLPTTSATPVVTTSATPFTTPMPTSPSVDVTPVPTQAPTVKPTALATVPPTSTPIVTPYVTASPRSTSIPTPTPPGSVLGTITTPVPTLVASVAPTIQPSTTPAPTASLSPAQKRHQAKKNAQLSASVIDIFAEGTAAMNVYPTMQLYIDHKPVKTFTDVGAYTDYTFTYPKLVKAEQIKIMFTNDMYLPFLKQDRNLRIDKITLNGIDYQTEAPASYSTGTWTSQSGCGAGHKDSEWLHCNGFIEY